MRLNTFYFVSVLLDLFRPLCVSFCAFAFINWTFTSKSMFQVILLFKTLYFASFCGHLVAQLVAAQRYEPAGHGFDS
jgi:hypothetical protein